MSFVKSQTTFIKLKPEYVTEGLEWVPYGDSIPETRTMLGQAPYVINAILIYEADSSGWDAAVSYNVQGPKLVLTSTNNAPDIYELPRHMVDVKVSKKFGKHLSVSLKVRNALNSPIRRSYNYTEGWLLDFDRYRFGTGYSLGLSYKL